MILQLKRRSVLVGSGRNRSMLAGMQWHTSGNGKTCHFLISSNCMYMTTTRTKACNKYMDVIFSPSYRIRSGMMVKQVHQHWEHDLRKKRIQQHSCFIDPDELPIKCSLCRKAEHNHRTCHNVVA